MSKNRSLSLRTQWLGERLRDARVAAGLTLVEAGQQLHLTDTSLSRFEKGMVRVRRPYVKEMIDFYGVSDPRERDALLKLNDDSWRKDWWDADISDLEMGFLDYTWLEARASRICAFCPMLIPGLLQIPDYVEAMTHAGLGSGATKEAVARAVELRTIRQRILGHGKDPTLLSVVIEETSLRRTIGDRDVRLAQLRHLIQVSRRRNIDLRVLPIGGWHPGLNGPFTYFDMPDPYPHVAYCENLSGRTFLEADEKVDRHREAYDELHRLALGPKASTQFIHTLIEELD